MAPTAAVAPAAPSSAPSPAPVTAPAAVAASIDPAPALPDFAQVSGGFEGRWPHATVTAARDTAIGPHRWQRLRLVSDPGQSYPVRIEETVRLDPATGTMVVERYQEMVADRVLVRIADGASPDFLEDLGFKPQLLYGQETLFCVQLPEASLDAVPEALARLDDNRIEQAGPDGILHTLLAPNDPLYASGQQWSMNAASDIDIDAPEAWDRRTDASSVIVAVIDSGTNLNHEDLNANLWRNPNEIPGDGIDNDANLIVDDIYGIDTLASPVPGPNPQDANGHGSHVAGTIGAVGNNGKGVAGVAWKVRIITGRFIGSTGFGSTSQAVTAIRYAGLKGAQIFNCSFGSTVNDFALNNEFVYWGSRGRIFVCAAGNDGINIDVTPIFPAAYDYPYVVTVAASSQTDTRPGFSNYGTNRVEIAAPGVSIPSAWIPNTNSYSTASGTSVAAPHVTGALAVLLAERPGDGLTAVTRLMAGADRPTQLTSTSSLGRRLNLNNALRLEDLGGLPVMNSGLTDQFVMQGSTLTLTVAASGTPPLTWVWRRDGVVLPGFTTNQLQISNVQRSHQGRYQVSAINSLGEAVSSCEVLVVTPVPTVATAVEADTETFFSYGDGVWTTGTDEGGRGIVAMSPPLDDRQFSALYTVVEGPGTIYFRWRVSSEAEFDFLQYWIDDQIYGQISGGTYGPDGKPTWELVSEPIAPGTHVFTWIYAKDYAVFLGEDRGLLDDIDFVPDPVEPPTLLNVVSRRSHGGQVFDLPVSGAGTTIEPRFGPLTLVFTFDKPIASAVPQVQGTFSGNQISVSGSQVTITITEPATGQWLTAALSSIQSVDGGALSSASATLGYLVGDANGDRRVNAGDALLVSRSSGQVSSPENFRLDVDASGAINAADALRTKLASGTALP